MDEAESTAQLRTIAIHYIDAYYRAGSLAIDGVECTGGFINLASANTAFNNEISSTLNYCGSGEAIAHYDRSTCDGASAISESDFPDLRAYGMNDRTSCIVYG